MEQTIILPYDQLSDTELVHEVLSGNKRMFEFIIRRYNQRLFRVGMSILSNDMEVEDAMQTAYIKAYEHLASFEHRSSLSTWLTKILINECLWRKKQSKRFEETEAEKHIENIQSMRTPANILMNKELGNAIEQAITQLPEKYRVVFVLREIEEMSVKETVETLGIEESNVKVRLNRAKTMLRENLSNHLKEQVYAFHLTRCDRIVNNVLSQII